MINVSTEAGMTGQRRSHIRLVAAVRPSLRWQVRHRGWRAALYADWVRTRELWRGRMRRLALWWRDLA